jgi:hypothetical protein
MGKVMFGESRVGVEKEGLCKSKNRLQCPL